MDRGGPSARESHLFAPRSHEESGRRISAGDPAQRAAAGAADAPELRRQAKVRLALVPLSLSSRRRHARKAPRHSRLPGVARLSHRADHHRLGGLPLEQRARALRREAGCRGHRMAAQQLSRRGATLDERATRPVTAGLGTRHQACRPAASRLVQPAHPAGTVCAAEARGLPHHHAGAGAERSDLRIGSGCRRCGWRHAHRTHDAGQGHIVARRTGDKPREKLRKSASKWGHSPVTLRRFNRRTGLPDAAES